MMDMEVSNINRSLTSTRKDNVKNFLRFMASSHFFDFDDENEIAKTKNLWAVTAYAILLEKNNGVELDEIEEKFLNSYFEVYLLNTNTVGLEKSVKGYYLKYRMTRAFEKTWFYEDNDEKSLEEFRLTIQSLINELYDTDYNLILTDEDIFVSKKDLMYLMPENNEIIMMKAYLNEIYNAYIKNDYDAGFAFLAVDEIITLIESNKLNDVKKHGISDKAIVYTVEDYFASKANKKNKLGELYKQLYENIIANKQIFIDASLNAYDKLRELEKKFKTSTCHLVDSKLEKYLEEKKGLISRMKHYYPDAKYFDTNNLEEDAFSKLFNMYVHGLKAMPKSNLTDVSKYFVTNGDALTTLDMDYAINKLTEKIRKEKNPEKKVILEEKLVKVKSTIDFVKKQSYSYTLEDTIRKHVENKKNITPELLNDIKVHYGDLIEVETRLKAAINNVKQIVSSGSASKVAHVFEKYNKLHDMLTMCLSIENEIYDSIEVDYNRDIVIGKISNNNKAIAITQELTGKNLLDCDIELDNSMMYNEPLIYDLNPGFKEFAMNALKNNGIKEFKTK